MARLGLHAGCIHFIDREAMYLKASQISCYIVILRNVPYKKHQDSAAFAQLIPHEYECTRLNGLAKS